MGAKPTRDMEAYTHGVAVVQVIDLTSMLPTCGLRRFDDADDFIEAIEEKRHASLAPLADTLSRLRAMDEMDDDEEVDADSFSDALLDEIRLGFALQVQTPVRREGHGSWGRCYSTWVYDSTYEGAWQHAVEWAKQRAAGDLARGANHA